MIETSLCIECGTNTATMGFVNRVSAGRDQIDAYVCGMCIATWELRDTFKDGKQVYCPAKDKEELNIDWDVENEEDYEYEFCDDAEQIHIKAWHPEVDATFPDAPKFRAYMETESNWSEAQIKEVQNLIDTYRVHSLYAIKE